MSLLNSQNKLYNTYIKSVSQKSDLEKIKTVDFKTFFNHNIKTGIISTLIEETDISIQDDNILIQTFKFQDLNEKIIPFLKFIPKIRTFDYQEISNTAELSFLYNWIKYDAYYLLKTGIYAKELNDDDKQVQLFVSLDVFITNLNYVNKIYNITK